MNREEPVPGDSAWNQVPLCNIIGHHFGKVSDIDITGRTPSVRGDLTAFTLCVFPECSRPMPALGTGIRCGPSIGAGLTSAALLTN